MSIFVQTAGGSAARSPEITTSSDTSFWRFFARIITTSTDEHAPSAPSSISMGPGAALCFLSASNGTACPEGIWATNSSPPTHFTVAVCKIPPLKTQRVSRGKLYMSLKRDVQQIRALRNLLNTNRYGERSDRAG